MIINGTEQLLNISVASTLNVLGLRYWYMNNTFYLPASFIIWNHKTGQDCLPVS